MNHIKPSKRIKRNLRIFAVCLLASVFLWASFVLGETYKSVLTYPIHFKTSSFSDSRIESSENSIQVEITDNGFPVLFRKWLSRKQEIQFSLKELKIKPHNGKAVFWCENYKSEIARQLHLDKDKFTILTNSIDLKWIPLEQKNVSPLLNVELHFKNQHKLYSNPVIYPKTITLHGSKKSLKNIRYIETKPFVLSGLSHSFWKIFSLKTFPEYPDVVVPLPYILVYFPVEKYTEISLDVPITVQTNRHEQIRIFPDKAKVVASVALKDFKSVTPDLFQLTLNFDEHVSGGNTLPLHLTQFPDFVKIQQIQPENVQYVIIKK